MTWRQCTLCRKQIARQLELNRHTVEDHDYKFLCSWHTCKMSITSKSALDKHSITHKPPYFMCSMCNKEFFQKYQMKSHKNVHNLDKEFRCLYPRCNHVYKSQGEYNCHYRSHCRENEEFQCQDCDKPLQKKRTWTSTWNNFKEVCKTCGKKIPLEE